MLKHRKNRMESNFRILDLRRPFGSLSAILQVVRKPLPEHQPKALLQAAVENRGEVRFFFLNLFSKFADLVLKILVYLKELYISF